MEEPANNNKPNNKKNIFKPMFNVMWIYVILLGGIAFMWFSYDGGDTARLKQEIEVATYDNVQVERRGLRTV